MTTNQEGRQAAIRDSTSTAYGVAADWHALFDDAGISAGTFNERLLAWINDQLGTSYSNLLGAMAAYAADAGYNAWSSISTLVLGGASTLLSGETDGIAFDFTDSSARIKDTSKPANEYSSTGIVSNGSLVGPSGKLTYTSPSNKLTLQSDGYYKYQAHNLCLQSEDFTTTWSPTNIDETPNATTDPNGGTTADKIYVTVASATQYRTSMSFTSISGAEYVFSVCAKASEYDYLLIKTNLGTAYDSYFDLTNGVAGTTSGSHTVSDPVDLGGGWYRFTVRATSTISGTSYFNVGPANADNAGAFVGAVNSGIYVWGAHIYRYPANTDYIRTTTATKYALPMEYDTSGNCLGLLVEEQRTNVWLNSRTQSGANVGANALLNSGITTSVFNDTTHKVINENATTADRFFYYRNITGLTSSGQYCVSVVSKAVDRDYISLSMRPGAASNGYRALFNLATGAFVSEGSVGAGLTSTGYGIEDVGNGWYRVYITANIGANTNCYFEIGASSSASPSYVSNMAYYNGTAGTDAIEVDQTQVELGSFPTSPILTYGAAATRNADNISIATSAFPWSATAFSIYARGTLSGIVSGLDNPVATVTDGTSNERILLRMYDAGTSTQFAVIDGGSLQASITLGTVAINTEYKMGAAGTANEFDYSRDGSPGTQDVSGTLPTVTTLYVGAYNTSSYFNGKIAELLVVPRKKTSAELDAETA